MADVLNFKRILITVIFIVCAITLFSDTYAKVTLSDPLNDPNTIIVKFDESSDFGEFRAGIENVRKELLEKKEKFGDMRQVKYYNEWLFNLTIIFDKNLSLSLQGNDYVSRFKLYDIFARILLSDFNLLGVVKDGVSADYATIFERFNEHIYKCFEQVPSVGAGIIFHTDVSIH